MRELFFDKTYIDFQDFLTWKVKTVNVLKVTQYEFLFTIFLQGTRTELPKLLEELFKSIDDGDGHLDPEELVTLEARLSR